MPAKFPKFIFLSLVLFLGGAACADTKEQMLTDGQSSLSVADLKNELLALPKSSRSKVLSDKRQAAAYVASILSNRRAVEAAAATGIADSAEVRAEVARARRDAIARIYVESQVAKAEAALPDAASFTALAREKYLANQAAYARPETVRVAHILFRVDVENELPTEAEVRAKAEKTLAALKNGADFAATAKELSDDTRSAKLGGELSGLVPRGKMVPPFERAAFALKPGEMSGLVRTRYGFHIIKLLEHHPATVRPFEEVREELVTNLRMQVLGERRTEIMRPFNATTEVAIDDSVMEALRN